MKSNPSKAVSPHNYTLGTVSRVFDVLEFIGQHDRGVGLGALSAALHLPKATVFRYLVTLEERDYVRKEPGNGDYRLGLKILDLGNKVMMQMPIHEVALPCLRDLLTRFHETVNLGILEHNEIVYLEVLESPRAFKMSAQLGARDYPHATSIGKAILAFLPSQEMEKVVRATRLPKRTKNTISSITRLKEELALTRQRGYSIDDEENEEGARCVGAPLLDYQGKVIAGVSLSGPAPRFSEEVIEQMGAALIDVQSQVSQKMQYLKKP